VNSAISSCLVILNPSPKALFAAQFSELQNSRDLKTVALAY